MAKSKSTVPVYTVHTLPQPYELLSSIQVHCSRTLIGSPLDSVCEDLGALGHQIGADAVIGLMIVSGDWSNKSVTAFGTAVKYI